MRLNAESCVFRFVVLFFTCMLTFGSYFCFDMPSVLQSTFQGNICINGTSGNNSSGNSSSNATCCEDCLGMSADDYNLLYAIYAWTNAVVVIGAGFFIDKVGNRIGVFVFSFLCVVGSSTFAVGAMFKGSGAMLPLMLIGRLIFGSGNGSLTIVQNRIIAFWFKDKELALAFGFSLAFSRLGSVLNFLVTENIVSSIGLPWTLWGGAMLCGFGFISAIIVGLLDVYGTRQLGTDSTIKENSKKMRFSDIRYFSLSFWLLSLTIMFFYNGVFPFVADASKFIHDKYKYDPKVSAYLAGAVYDVSMVLSPFLGGIIDKFGKRGYLAIVCALASIPVFGILAFTTVYPLVATLWFGITYSLAAASLWPSIPLVVPQATIGTAMGLTTSMQMIGIGICNVVVGTILGKNKNLSREDTLLRWKYVMIFLLANIIVCVTTAVALNLNDKRKGGILNRSLKEKRLQQRLDAESKDEDDERKPLLEDDNQTRRRTTIN
ncbi:unnamed protein product [Owenia fusiformis]|uniref:Lysosomal dipeptide transporter MFSD1 n=1 Tax=Owenia fusiformis TaxID=6347 RepID=A0A8J1XUP6_OWEFU|nr:unnamed protein product [Owenia fusiformis]